MSIQEIIKENIFRGPKLDGLFPSNGEVYSIITYKEVKEGKTRYITEAWKCWGCRNRRDIFLEGLITPSEFRFEKQHETLYMKVYNEAYYGPSFGEKIEDLLK